MDAMNMGTVVPRSACLIATPASVSACSKVKLHPSRKPDQVIAPPAVEALALEHELTLLVDAIARDIGAQIRARC